jgi:hypothetical protein
MVRRLQLRNEVCNNNLKVRFAGEESSKNPFAPRACYGVFWQNKAKATKCF